MQSGLKMIVPHFVFGTTAAISHGTFRIRTVNKRAKLLIHIKL